MLKVIFFFAKAFSFGLFTSFRIKRYIYSHELPHDSGKLPVIQVNVCCIPVTLVRDSLEVLIDSTEFVFYSSELVFILVTFHFILPTIAISWKAVKNILLPLFSAQLFVHLGFM